MRTDRFMLCAVLVMALVSVTPAFGQWVPKRVESDGSDIPRTPWGHPDLQGLWNNSTTTPLERLTEEERVQGYRAQRAVIEATGGTGAGWLEQAGAIDRASLIVDPSCHGADHDSTKVTGPRTTPRTVVVSRVRYLGHDTRCRRR